MVRDENPNLPLRDKHSEPNSEPDAPPGFPPQPPLNMKFVAQNSPNIHNPASNGSAARLPNPNSTGEQPPGRTTTRKRARPQFYAPPPCARKPLVAPRRRGRPPKAGLPPPPQIYASPPAGEPRRRGRPPKARLMPQLSGQDIETRNCDQVPSTPLINNQVIVQSALTNVSPMPREIETTGPANGYKSTGNVDQNGQMIDPMIFQHVSSALQCMDRSQTPVDETKLKSSNENLVHMLKAIYKKHGDIAQRCSLESDCMKTLVLLGICKVVQDLQGKQLADLDISTLDSYYTTVRDAESLNIKVRWLRKRLDEIREFVELADEVKGLADIRNRRLESIEEKKAEVTMHKVELQRLELEIQKVEELVRGDNSILYTGERTLKYVGRLVDGLVN